MTKPKLTTEQSDAIQKSHDVMRDMLDNIYDIQDIYLTDIKKLDEAFHQLKFHFEIEFELNEEQ